MTAFAMAPATCPAKEGGPSFAHRLGFARGLRNWPRSRGERLVARLHAMDGGGGADDQPQAQWPDFAQVGALPGWTAWPETRRRQLCQIVALLFHRALIDHELSGPRLKALADLVGEPMFDAVCDCEMGQHMAQAPQGWAIPGPQEMAALGGGLLERTLPGAWQSAPIYSGSAGDGVGAESLSHLVDRAVELIGGRDCASSNALDGAP